ncbi:hypothetical protein [Phaeodactylibacter xiamenensis]|uniref:hypothetical protein n=1 Tax=Phaeodactylibacter xiamenensis TaxID=1524460 RepID=UPI003BA9DE36
MKLIHGILNTQEVSYSSNLNKDRLKEKFDNLFEQKALIFKGKFTNNNEFVAYDKLNVIGWNMPNLRRKSAYLKGEITQKENRTLVKLVVKPNSLLPIFAILAILGGSIITILTLSNTENDKFFSVFGLVLIGLGVIYYPVSSLLRNRLRNKIVEYLDLKKV